MQSSRTYNPRRGSLGPTTWRMRCTDRLGPWNFIPWTRTYREHIWWRPIAYRLDGPTTKKEEAMKSNLQKLKELCVEKLELEKDKSRSGAVTGDKLGVSPEEIRAWREKLEIEKEKIPGRTKFPSDVKRELDDLEKELTGYGYDPEFTVELLRQLADSLVRCDGKNVVGRDRKSVV